MKLKYLGTAAAEGVPAIFCECDVCKYSRKHGGKNIRTRSQAIVDDKLLLDFGPDTYFHSLKYGIDLTHIYHCLITHPHEDHLYADEIHNLREGFAYLCESTPPFTLYGAEETAKAAGADENGVIIPKRANFVTVKGNSSFMINDYKIFALKAIHGTKEPLAYAIEKGGKTLLYAHDTGIFTEETFDYIKQNNLHFDYVSFDCTEGLRKMDYSGHMNIERNVIFRNLLIEKGFADDNTVFCLNHFSHNCLLTYDDAVKESTVKGFLISYDGMEVEI